MKLLMLVQIGDSMKIGSYCGLDPRLRKPDMLGAPKLEIDAAGSYALDLGDSALGSIQRLENLAKGLTASKEQLEAAKNQLAGAKAELNRPWAQETELREKSERLTQRNIKLNVGGNEASTLVLNDEDEPKAEHAPRQRAVAR